MGNGVKHMKWWGWGEEHIAFDHHDKPALAPFVKTNIGVDLDAPPVRSPAFDSLDVPPPRLRDDVLAALRTAVGAEHVVTDDLDRVVHAYGKSLRDLVRVRAGDLGRVPDAVVYPGDEAAVVALMNAALDLDLVLIAFGGGSNISGSLEAPRTEVRTVVSVDMGRMRSLVEIDEASNLARIQAGALGPDLEQQLNARGWTLGHFPDSFNHSTLGGWIATRSSGMQSDKYGDIADITRGLRVVGPAGTLVVRAVPSTSTGPSVREMILGSEGRLGIITEATVQVHRAPEVRTILAYLFPDWTSGLDAMRELAASDAQVSVTRVSDENETAFSFATTKRAGVVSRLQLRALKTFLRRRKGFDTERMCLSFIGFEGAAATVKTNRALVAEIVGRHRGFCVGSGPGALYDQKKFDTPYIRDFLLDRGALGDVSETAAPWSALRPLYDAATDEARRAFARIGVQGWVMCHLSHSYRSGACLYFTFAFAPAPGTAPLEQYDVVKHAVQQAFVDHHGTLSHHHAVGVEHAPWLADDISPAGVRMLDALFDGVDPGRNCNPGKITGR
jgi:alkyldihydroxyacetonephosphate synthase